jgi:beta-galactosidase GanA
VDLGRGLRLEDAEPLAEFTAAFYAGGPAIARRLVGDGQAIYVGTVFEDAGLEWLLEIAAAAGLVRSNRPQPEVEISTVGLSTIGSSSS